MDKEMGRKKILVIDDEVDLADLLKTRLQLQNYYVVPCYTSKRGLEIAKRERPDVILLDVMMPDLDGYEVCKSLKNTKETKDIPVILFTGKEHEAKRIKEKCVETGADDYVLKPFEPDMLLKKIQGLLELRR